MKLTTGQQKFIDLALSGQNIFLTGKAGTGKSFVIKEFIKRCNKNVAKLGTTGVAAINIGGQTVHSFFGINPFEIYNGRNAKRLTGEKRDVINKTDVIIIDEVSMMRTDVLDAINGTMMFNRCGYLSDKQIIFVGDMKQLPVIERGNVSIEINRIYGGHEFYKAKGYKYLNVATVELTEVKRQSDHRFIEALNKVRDGKKDPYFKNFVSKTPNNGVILAPHNSTVERYNKSELEKLPGRAISLKAQISGKINVKNYPVSETITIKDGARVMYCVNDKKEDLINGDIGIVNIYEDGIYFTNNRTGRVKEVKEHHFENQEYVIEKKEIENEDGTITIESELVLKTIGMMTQYPIKLAYALSIHKSQGMTFDEVTVDISRRCFVPGQMYVALSRCKTPQGLKIIV